MRRRLLSPPTQDFQPFVVTQSLTYLEGTWAAWPVGRSAVCPGIVSGTGSSPVPLGHQQHSGKGHSIRVLFDNLHINHWCPTKANPIFPILWLLHVVSSISDEAIELKFRISHDRVLVFITSCQIPALPLISSHCLSFLYKLSGALYSSISSQSSADKPALRHSRHIGQVVRADGRQRMVQTRRRLHQHDLGYDCENFTSHHTEDEMLTCKLACRYGPASGMP